MSIPAPDSQPSYLPAADKLRLEIAQLREALCMMYDKWENGDGCSDENGVFLGNAFRLTQEEEEQVLALIPSFRNLGDCNDTQRGST